MDDVEKKRLARMTLCAMAGRAKASGLSALEWEDSVEETAEGKLLGKEQVSAIGSVIFTGSQLR